MTPSLTGRNAIRYSLQGFDGKRHHNTVNVLFRQHWPDVSMVFDENWMNKCREDNGFAKQDIDARKRFQPRDCQECGKLFPPSRGDQVFCCPDCRKQHDNKRRNKRRKNIPPAPYMPRTTVETWWNGLDFTPGCEGPASPAYCPLEQRLGAEIW
jgi:hypothetical protein